MQTDGLRNSADDITRRHRQPLFRRRGPLEDALGEHTVGMKQLLAADRSA
jgi:hypothetical protein